MTHPHPWRMSEGEEARWPGVHGEIEVVDAVGNFVCWAYREEAEAIVAASEAVGLLRRLADISSASSGRIPLCNEARALLARIGDD